MKKEKFIIEYVFDNASKKSLWPLLTTASGLSEWFADNVIAQGNTYEFVWNKHTLKAEQLSIIPDTSVKFRWLEEDDPDVYFGFQLHTNELTGALMLEVVDFSEPSEKKDSISLWDSEVKTLRRRLGL